MAMLKIQWKRADLPDTFVWPLVSSPGVSSLEQAEFLHTQRRNALGPGQSVAGLTAATIMLRMGPQDKAMVTTDCRKIAPH